MSSYRHILMHADSSVQAVNRVGVCRALAARFGAEVTVLYAVTPWLLRYPAALDASGAIATQLSQWDQERLTETHERILNAASGDSAVRWARLDEDSPLEFAKEALYADLLVLGQRLKDDPSREDVPPGFLSHVILRSGKPVLVLPPHQSDLPQPRVVLIGWNGTRESASALTASMPWLKEAQAVHVVCEQRPGQGDGEVQALDRLLRLHGLEATFHTPPPDERDAGQLLLDQARQLGADLLVMGCYGHSRAREWVLGGATRTVLEEATLPVLMVH